MSAAADQGEYPDGDQNGGNILPAEIGTPKRKRTSFTCPICEKTFSTRSIFLQHSCFSSTSSDDEDPDERRENARSVKGKKSSPTQEEKKTNLFEGSELKKVLGEHRGSHEGVMGCSAVSTTEEREVAEILVSLKEKGSKKEKRKHICQECRREFDSGSALGGHMRSHSPIFKHPFRAAPLLPPPPDNGSRAWSSVERSQGEVHFPPPMPPEYGGRYGSSVKRWRLKRDAMKLSMPVEPPTEDGSGAGSRWAGSRLECEGLDFSSPAQSEYGSIRGSSMAGCATLEPPCLKSRWESWGLDLNFPPPPEDDGDEVEDGKCIGGK